MRSLSIPSRDAGGTGGRTDEPDDDRVEDGRLLVRLPLLPDENQSVFSFRARKAAGETYEVLIRATERPQDLRVH